VPCLPRIRQDALAMELHTNTEVVTLGGGPGALIQNQSGSWQRKRLRPGQKGTPAGPARKEAEGRCQPQ
jgi:hypothetical protein